MGGDGELLERDWSPCAVLATAAWTIATALLLLAWAMYDDPIVQLLLNTSLFFAGVGLAVQLQRNAQRYGRGLQAAFEVGREREREAMRLV